MCAEELLRPVLRRSKSDQFPAQPADYFSPRNLSRSAFSCSRKHSFAAVARSSGISGQVSGLPPPHRMGFPNSRRSAEAWLRPKRVSCIARTRSRLGSMLSWLMISLESSRMMADFHARERPESLAASEVAGELRGPCAYSGETGQSFHAKLDSHSRANWTVGA